MAMEGVWLMMVWPHVAGTKAMSPPNCMHFRAVSLCATVASSPIHSATDSRVMNWKNRLGYNSETWSESEEGLRRGVDEPLLLSKYKMVGSMAMEVRGCA